MIAPFLTCLGYKLLLVNQLQLVHFTVQYLSFRAEAFINLFRRCSNRLRLGFLSYMLTGTTDIIFWSSVFFDGGSGNFRSCGNDGRIGSAGNDGNTGKLFGARLNKASRIWPLDKSYIFIVRKRDFRKKRHRISFFHAAAPFLNNMKPLL